MSSIYTQVGGAAGVVSPDLPVGLYHELTVGLSLTALAGGASPSVGIVVKVRGEDGILYQISAPAALTAVGVQFTSLGAGLGITPPNTDFGDLIQVSVVVAGGPTGCSWSLSVSGK